MIENEKDTYAEAIFRKIEMDRKIKEDKVKEYDNCNHLFIPTYRVSNACSCENRQYEYCGCVKCGLDLKNVDADRRYLSGDDELQHDYLTQTKNRIKFEYVTPDLEMIRDVKLAHAVYKRINKYYPNIDDDKALEYLGSALYHLGNIEVNEDRKKSRIHRLGLSYTFNNWKKEDVDDRYK